MALNALPTNPLAQNDRLIMAVCLDLQGKCFGGDTGHAERVIEINKQSTREARAAEKAAGQ